jgi:hypothetical protein
MRFSVVHKPQDVMNLTRRLSKASPGAYRSYRMIHVTFLAYLCMCCLCTTCRVLYDGDRLYGSTLSYVILVVEVFMFRTTCAILS